jgi:hypothetical protein
MSPKEVVPKSNKEINLPLCQNMNYILANDIEYILNVS